MTPAAAVSRRRRLAAVLVWLAFLASCALVVARTRFTADLSAFLPSAPTPAQQMLVDQLRDGMVSRLVLVGLNGGEAPARARLSHALAERLAADPAFVSVNNGEPRHAEADRAWLFGHRYVLSDAVSAEHFSADGLRAAIGNTLDLLASPAGLLVKPLLTRDPTGEMAHILEGLSAQTQPVRSPEGVWISRDGKRALLLAATRAAGSDTDAQAAAIAAIRDGFAELVRHDAQAAGVKLEMTGPGVFAVSARNTIESEATRLALIGAGLIVVLLLIVYRSLTALALGLLPVLTGALAGVAAVSLGFGVVHGVTLGFGTTLIGEAVDYAIYLFIQSGRGSRSGMAGFWPTIRLGVLTSVCGFAALLASAFPGLAQLGLYSIAGLAAAAVMTRFVLPALVPESLQIRDVAPVGRAFLRLAQGLARLRWLAAGLAVAALVVLVQHRDGLWHDQLSALSPVSAAEQALDTSLRADLGAPDVRWLVAIDAATPDEALRASGQVSAQLDKLVGEGAIAGFNSPSHYLPSAGIQQQRLAALPPRDELSTRLAAATRGLPLRADKLSPFLDDVEQARRNPPATRADMQGSSLAQAVDAMLMRQAGHWRALLPLRAMTEGPMAERIDAGRLRAALQASGVAGATFIDLKLESNAMYAGYLHEAILLALGGAVAIVVLLAVALRRPGRLLRVIAPLALAVLLVAACLALAGERLTLLHLVGMLLVAAVGSNYALFFDGLRGSSGEDSERTLASLVLANLTAVIGFGVLGFSSVPVLHAIGIVVGPGALLALLLSAMMNGDALARRESVA